MKRTKMRAEMTPKERIAHWALDAIKFITLLASIPFILAAYAWPMVVGAVIAHQLRSRGGEILVGFFVFVLLNKKLCKPAAEWVFEHVGDFHAWLDRFDPAVYDDDPVEPETPPASASTLEKYLAAAREQQAWANREKEKPAAREKEEQAAYEKAMRKERERAAKWIEDNKDEIKAFAKSTEERDKAKRKRTRIVVVLAVVLAVLLLAAFAGNLLLDVVVYAGLIFFYALFFAVYGSPIFFFCMFVVFRKMRNFKLAVLLSILAAVGVVLTVMYLTKDSPIAEDRPLRYGEYPGIIGF